MSKVLANKLTDCYDTVKRANKLIDSVMEEIDNLKAESAYDIYDELIEVSNDLYDINVRLNKIIQKAENPEVKFLDSSDNLLRIKNYVKSYIDLFLDNDDEISEKYEKPLRNIQNSNTKLTKISKGVLDSITKNGLSLDNIEDFPRINSYVYSALMYYSKV